MMGNYEQLKTAVASIIRDNGEEEITGNVLQSVLISIINSVGSGAVFAGIATPSTSPSNPDPNTFYIAVEAGVYPNFNLTVTTGMCIFSNETGTWVGHELDVSSQFESGEYITEVSITDTLEDAETDNLPTVGAVNEAVTALNTAIATERHDRQEADGNQTVALNLEKTLRQQGDEANEASVGYYVCDTAAATAAKAVNASGYVLRIGGNIRIEMTNANTADNATLNINSTGAKALYYNGAQASASNSWEAGEVLEVYYDGTQYQCTENGSDKIKELGELCLQEGTTEEGSQNAEMYGWNPETGGITSFKTRAHLKLSVKGFELLEITIPSGWYAQFYYVNDGNISQGSVTGSLDWYVGERVLALNGQYDIMLNIKYGSAGSTNISQAMVDGVTWTYTKSVPEHYTPAAPMSEIDDIDAALYGDGYYVGTDAFIQGSNDASGNIISSTKRLITASLVDCPNGTTVTVVNNGQKHVILTYSSEGVYETTTGWIESDGVYSYNADKKLRFLVAKLDDSTIVPSENVVSFYIKTQIGIVEEIEELKQGQESVSIKANDQFNLWNKTILLYNPYKDKPASQFKGQLHCHTTNSDGADSPVTVVGKYLAAGYDFMTITDHNYVTPDPSVQGMVWMGTSYEDTHNSAGFQHMNVYNTTEVYNRASPVQTSNSPQMIVQHFVKEGNSVVSYNHPEYPPVYASDATLEGLPIGISMVEVFNGTIQTLLGTVASASELPSEAYYGDMYDCTGDGKRYVNTSVTYASPNWRETTAEQYPDGNLDRGFRIMLDNGHKVFCNAVDDYHRGDNMFDRGWMIVFANSRTKESIWNAILNGCSYASAGVTLSNLQVKDGVMSFNIENGEDATTTFYGEDNTVLATMTGSSASYQIQGTEKYVRAMVQIGRFKAWTQPVWVVGVKDQYTF